MKWYKYKQFDQLPTGCIVIDEDGTPHLVGDVGNGMGTSDEFFINAKYFTGEFAGLISRMVQEAKEDFDKNKDK